MLWHYSCFIDLNGTKVTVTESDSGGIQVTYFCEKKIDITKFFSLRPDFTSQLQLILTNPWFILSY